jgi:hypothetical protein
MTPKQKQVHQANIQALLGATGFTQDKWGNWKNTTGDQQYRIKLKKINIRIERKSPFGWTCIISKPVVNMSLEKLASFLARFQA